MTDPEYEVSSIKVMDNMTVQIISSQVVAEGETGDGGFAIYIPLADYNLMDDDDLLEYLEPFVAARIQKLKDVEKKDEDAEKEDEKIKKTAKGKKIPKKP